jgi:hypothetical protein
MFTSTFRRIFTLLIFAWLSVNQIILAQTTAIPNQGKPADQGATAGKESEVKRSVFGSISENRIRLSALGELIQLRLEVIAPSGEMMFDSAFVAGNALDWVAANNQGQPLADAAYLCLITVKDGAGNLSKHRALLVARDHSLDFRQVEASQLAPAQTQVAGESPDAEGSFTLVEANASTATAILAHDGNTAQLVSGRGGLTISGGNFFANKVLEHIRLTAEGNLGIGTSQPQARLDVNGFVRSSQGIVFPDGSVQFSASSRTYGAASQRPSQPQGVPGQENPNVVNISGTGTTGRLSKWLDGPNGVLNDSNITEVSGAIGINAPPDTRFRLDVNGSVRFRGSNPGFNLEGLRPQGNVWAFQTVDDDGRFRLFGQDNVNPGQERLTIKLDTGNIGIGTSSPVGKLNIVGSQGQTRGIQIDNREIKFRGDTEAHFSIYANRFARKLTIEDTSENFNVGTPGSVLMTIANDGNIGIGTSSPGAKLHIAGADSGGTGLAVESSQGDRASMYYNGSIGLVFDSFRPSDSRRLPILLQSNGGRVIIGPTTTPNLAKLNVFSSNAEGCATVTIGYGSPSGFNCGFVALNILTDTPNSSLIIGGVNGSPAFTVSGTGTVCATNIACASDARLKQNVRNLDYGLAQLLRLRPARWEWREARERQLPIGLVAQEVEDVMPELVLREADPAKPLGLNYLGLVPVVINAIKEQQALVEKQNDTIKRQQSQIEALKKLICLDHPEAEMCKP